MLGARSDGNHDVQYSAQQGGVLEVQIYAASPSATAAASNEFVEDDGVSLDSGTRTTSFAFDSANATLEWSVKQTKGGVAGVGTAYTHVRGLLFGRGGGVRRGVEVVPLDAGRLVFPP
jgi:hypothetical protein